MAAYAADAARIVVTKTGRDGNGKSGLGAVATHRREVVFDVSLESHVEEVSVADRDADVRWWKVGGQRREERRGRRHGLVVSFKCTLGQPKVNHRNQRGSEPVCTPSAVLPSPYLGSVLGRVRQVGRRPVRWGVGGGTFVASNPNDPVGCTTTVALLPVLVDGATKQTILSLIGTICCIIPTPAFNGNHF